MSRNKLTMLLRCFSKQELKRFGSYLEAPFSNSSEGSAKLIALLAPHHPGFENVPEKEELFEKLFPGKAFRDVNLRLLFSETYAAGRRFASLLLLESQPQHEAVLFMRYLHLHAADELLETELAAAEKTLDRRRKDNALHQVQRWLLDDTEFHLNIRRGKRNEIKASEKIDFKRPLHSLGAFYLNQRLVYQSFYSLTLKEPLPEELWPTYELIAGSLPETPPALELAKKTTLLIQDPGNEKLLRELLDRVHHDDLSYVDQALFSFMFFELHYSCLFLLWQGKAQYLHEKHKLWRRMAELGQFLYDGVAEPGMVCNFASSSCYFGETEYFQAFYKQIEKFIPYSVRKSTFHFCQAYMAFAAKDYSGALQHLQEVTYDSYRRRLVFKAFLLLIYYEKKDMDAVLAMNDSLRHFLLGTPNLMEAERQYNHNFVNAVGRLVRLAEHPNRQQLEEFRRTIEEQPTSSRRWLLEKVDELLATVKKETIA